MSNVHPRPRSNMRERAIRSLKAWRRRISNRCRSHSPTVRRAAGSEREPLDVVRAGDAADEVDVQRALFPLDLPAKFKVLWRGRVNSDDDHVGGVKSQVGHKIHFRGIGRRTFGTAIAPFTGFHAREPGTLAPITCRH